MGIFNSIIDFLNKFRNQNKRFDDMSFAYSRFSEFLDGIDENDENYFVVKEAVELCDDALKVAKRRLYYLKKYKEYSDRLKEVESYNKLSSEEADELKALVEQFVSLTKERNILRYQLVDFDKGVSRLADISADAENAIPKIKDAEYNQRVLKQDIGYLQAEWDELREEREKLEFGLDFIYKFTIGMVIVFASAVVFLAMTNVFKQQTVFFSLSLLAVLAIVIVSTVYFFRRKISFELKMNVKKQSKAVEILNKKNVVFAYYTNFLKYEYNKYKVKNSEMLVNHLKEFDHYKYVTSRYDAIRNIMYQTQENLEKFIKEKNIIDLNASIERFAKTLDVDDKMDYARRLTAAIQDAEENLKVLDDEHAKIWDRLTELKLNDNTDESLIETIISAYLSEVSRMSFVVKEDDDDENLNQYEEDKFEYYEGLGEDYEEDVM